MMVRRMASKVMWVGRATVFCVGLAVILAVVLGVAATALAGTGIGAPFNLGETNTVNRLSTLVGSVGSGASLLIDNNSTNTHATALNLQVEPGRAPMRVNSSTKVNKLNSDQLDGKDSTGFLGADQKAVDSDKLDGLDAAAFERSTIHRFGPVAPAAGSALT